MRSCPDDDAGAVCVCGGHHHHRDHDGRDPLGPRRSGAGIWTNSKFRDIKPLQTYYYNKQTLAEFVGSENAEASAAGLNLAVENYEAGRQVTYKLYSDEEIAADPTKEVVELNYFPAKTPNAKYALVLSGNISTRTAELKECISTAYELHEKGYAVFTMRYRVFQNASDNAPLDDIGRAVQFITEHAKVFDVQTENYALLGYSSAGTCWACSAAGSWATRSTRCPSPVPCCWLTPSTISTRRGLSIGWSWIRRLRDPVLR